MDQKQSISEAYSQFQTFRDPYIEDFLIHELYRNLLSWIEKSQPSDEFLHELIEIYAIYQLPYDHNLNLLEIAVEELMDVVGKMADDGQHGQDDDQIREMVSRARLPLLARIDETTYRAISEIEFQEVDFYIYDTIGGQFPHEAAQAFLKSGKCTDVWLVIHYLEDLEDETVLLDVIEQMLNNLKSLPEKCMLLGYFIYRLPDQVQQMIENPARFHYRFSDDIPVELVSSIFAISKEMMSKTDFSLEYSKRILPGRQADTLFTLMAILEISQSELHPGWIDVIEQSMANLWIHSVKDGRSNQRHNPLPEFVVSFLNAHSEEVRERLLLESRILAIFFENLHCYTRATFEELLIDLSSREDLFSDELDLQLSLERESRSIRTRRLAICARSLGKQIISRNGRYYLVEGNRD